MQGYNVILLYNESIDRLLMCKRKNDPFKGLNNLVVGKIEPGEDGLDAVYRELFEETNTTKENVELFHLMDFTYYLQNCYLQVYVGKLKHDVNVKGDENELFWSDLNHDFFDLKNYAGEGNIGHMIEQVNMHADEIF